MLMSLLLSFPISLKVDNNDNSLSYIKSIWDNSRKSENLEVNSEEIKTIVIDPGHGGYDSGSIGRNGTIEKNVTLIISLKIGTILKEKGFNVVYTRESDEVIWDSDNKKDLTARAEIANNVSADAFISIHLNTFRMEEVKGIESFYYEENQEAKYMAESIHSEIINNVKANNRGVQSGDFSVLRKTNAPGVLIELGYISNRSEESLLNNPSYQDMISEAIANGIYNFLNT